MTSPAVTNFRRTFTLDGGRYQVDVIADLVAGKAVSLEFEWTPDFPKGQRRRRLLAEYRTKRNAVLQTLAAEIGGQILLIDL